MTTIFAHYTIMHAIPLLCGLGSGWIAQRSGGRVLHHLASLAGAALTAMILQYGALLVLAGTQTAQWPSSITLDGLAYALAWFAIPASFVVAPLVVVGHTATAILVRQRQLSAAQVIVRS